MVSQCPLTNKYYFFDIESDPNFTTLVDGEWRFCTMSIWHMKEHCIILIFI